MGCQQTSFNLTGALENLTPPLLENALSPQLLTDASKEPGLHIPVHNTYRYFLFDKKNAILRCPKPFNHVEVTLTQGFSIVYLPTQSNTFGTLI